MKSKSATPNIRNGKAAVGSKAGGIMMKTSDNFPAKNGPQVFGKSIGYGTSKNSVNPSEFQIDKHSLT